MKKLAHRVKGIGYRVKADGLVYDHVEIEAKWQKVWSDNQIYEPDIQGKPFKKSQGKQRKPFYNLMMFPYPSGEGLHVGHAFAFSGADIYGRFKRMHGEDVFEPIGFDSFGIHSENYALKIGEHPKSLIAKTTARYEGQLKSLGIGFSWKQKLSTSDIEYYRWTQWVFVKLFKAGLAYRAKAAVNWCPNCLTVLADEQVIGKQVTLPSSGQAIKDEKLTDYVCERCGTTVKKKDLTQWFFKITAYADRLLNNLEKLDWSDKIVVAQRNWIGKSKGAKILFQIDIEKTHFVAVFTTRPDTIYGVTYLALAPAHPLVTTILKHAKGLDRQQIREFVDYSLNKGIGQRGKGIVNEAKNGIFSGFYARNPLSGKKIPVYIADYVLMDYGSGAVMGVPAHDERDREFAKKYGIEIVQVVKSKNEADHDVSRNAFTEYGVLINSGEYNALTSEEVILKITSDLEKKKVGEEKTTWHLRDWIISRQRYWGPPIPMIFCEACAKEGKSWFTCEENSENQKVGGSVCQCASNVGTIGKVSGSVESVDPVGSVMSVDTGNTEVTDSTDNTESQTHRITEVSNKTNNFEWESAGWYPVPEEDLPVELPYMENFKPTGVGVSPLGQNEDFMKVKCPGCGGSAKRETDVSDTFLDSAWYFLRYPSVGKSVSRYVGKAGKVSGSVGSVRPVRSVSTGDTDNTEITDSTEKLPWDPEITKRWLPVDMYIGGAEHAVLHLLYSRFVSMAFADLGLVDFSTKGGLVDEPFPKFRAHGMVIKDGAKMSKSRGNVVVPDDYISKFGADTLRCYLMFCGRYSDGGDFRDSGIFGMQKFLKRVWRLSGSVDQWVSNVSESVGLVGSVKLVSTGDTDNTKITDCTENTDTTDTTDTPTHRKSLFMMHKTIKKVTLDIENLDYNTAIAAMMEWVNFLEKKIEVRSEKSEVKSQKKTITHEPLTINEIRTLLLLLAPFAPHMTEELWQKFSWGRATPSFKSIHLEKWPEFDEKLAVSQMATIVVQVNGKLKDKIEVERGKSKEEVLKMARKLQNISRYLSTGKVVAEIYVTDKLVNFVVQ